MSPSHSNKLTKRRVTPDRVTKLTRLMDPVTSAVCWSHPPEGFGGPFTASRACVTTPSGKPATFVRFHRVPSFLLQKKDDHSPCRVETGIHHAPSFYFLTGLNLIELTTALSALLLMTYLASTRVVSSLILSLTYLTII